MPQLDLAGFASQIFWLIITFSIFYLINSKIIIPKIRAIFEEREKIILEDLRQASEAEFQSQKIDSKYQNELLLAQQKAANMVNEAKEKIKIIEDQKSKEIDTDLASKFISAQEKIDLMVSEIDIKKITSDTANSVFKKLFNQEIDSKKLDETIVNMYKIND